MYFLKLQRTLTWSLREFSMPLINFTKEELQKIEYYLLGETDPIVVDILEKIANLDDLCECGGQTN